MTSADSAAYWADWFWRLAGGRGEYPQDIRSAAPFALPLSIHSIRSLSVASASRFYARGGIASPRAARDRRLRGCISISVGGGMILVEANDDVRQKRFTIAHEVAHYIIEVSRHSERAETRMGKRWLGVLYGERAASESERIDAWLANVRSAPFAHFMDRVPSGGIGCGETLRAECRADALALDLLAPRAEFVRAIGARGEPVFRDSVEAARLIAQRKFGLPAAIASEYAARVAWGLRRGASTAERFGFG